MSQTNIEMTGVLVCESVTPIIQTLFEGFNVSDNYPGNGRFHIAQFKDGAPPSWERVIDDLVDLAEELNIELPEDLDDEYSPEKAEIVISLFGDHFGASGNTDLMNFIENYGFNDGAEIEVLFFLAKIFNDGHKLKAYSIQTAWYCSRPELDEFGGSGDFEGTHFESHGTSAKVCQLGETIEQALEDGNLLVAANHLSANIKSLLNGVKDAEVRELVRVMLIEGLKQGEVELSYEDRVTALENQGMTRSDAQGVVDAEDRSKQLKQFEVVLQMEIGREYEWT